MESAGVPPTPCNFGLWYQHVSGTNPELSRQIAASMDQSATITAAALEELYANFLDPQVDEDEVAARAEGIRDAAQAIVDQVAGNGEHLRQYGNTLSQWSSRLGQDQTLDSLLHAVAMLSAETARASERNRDLERQLSASTARITRLKDSMQDLKREATTDILTGQIGTRCIRC
jgi:diguanylate cyclase